MIKTIEENNGASIKVLTANGYNCANNLFMVIQQSIKNKC